MRISTLQAFNIGLNGIKDVADQGVKTQQQISTGKRVLKPSDDPVVAARILELNEELASFKQYKRNMTNVESRLQLEDSLLSSVNNVITRATELAIQAGNGTLSTVDRNSVAGELQVRVEELRDIVNSRDASGNYIFAGFSGETIPFVEAPGGGYEYHGDEGQRFVRISDTTTMATGDNGKELFMDVLASQNTFFTLASAHNTADPAAVIDIGTVVDQAAYDLFYPEDVIIRFNDPPTDFDILQKSDGRILQDDVTYNAGTQIQFNGVGVRISGRPNAGDSFQVESTDKQGLLTTMARLVSGLQSLGNNEADNIQLTELVGASITNLQNAEVSVLSVRSGVGGRLNTLENTRSLLTSVEITTQELLSELQDLDYAEAVSRLTFETFILEAAQQSFVKVRNLSLFNFLR